MPHFFRQLFIAFIMVCCLSGTSILYAQGQSAGSSFTPVHVTAPRIPSTMTLFGERIPLELWDVRERLDREVLVNTYMQGTTSYIMKLMGRWLPMIEARLKANGIPDDFKYLCIAESALQNQISKAGAVGFWQFLTATAQHYGLVVDSEVDERYHAEKATDAACKYLRDAYAKFGSWTAAAASYNCGMGGYQQAISFQGVADFYQLMLPEETMRYIFRIGALKHILSNARDFGFDLKAADIYAPLKIRKETIQTGLGNLSQYARSQGTNYKTLKLLNPWLRDKSLTNSKGRTYILYLPQS